VIPPGHEWPSAQLDQLAGNAADAADIHGVNSPEHDRAMDAYDEFRGEHDDPEAGQ
jgi:hypothetical protein